jgi:hypothetical protein
VSSPLGATLLAAMRSDHRQPVSLYKIELATPSALTLYLASAEVMTPDGQLWESGASGGHIRQEVDSLGTGPNPASTTIYLEERRYSFQSSTGMLSDTLATYLWQGATVTLYLWERSLAAFTPSECMRFSGTVDSYSMDDLRLTLNCLQDRSWNKPVPTVSVDQTNYPNAPDGQQGAVIPIVYGSHIAPPLRSPHTASYTNKQYHEDSGAGSGAIPLILTDPGTGSADVQLVAASHAMGELLDRANGYTSFMVAGDVLAPLDTSGITETLTGPSYLTIDDDYLIAYYGARANDVRTTGGGTTNSALNPRRAMDVFNETTYATLNQTAGTDQEKLVLVGPNVASLGVISAVDVILCFSGDAANTQNIRVYPEELGVTFGTVVSVASTGTTPQILTGTWDAAYYSSNWQFGTADSGGPASISVDFAGASANNKARIYWVALRVKFKPSRNILTPAIINGQQVMSLNAPYIPFLDKSVPAGRFYTPGIGSLTGQFYSHAKGYVDDGSGTYTGSAAAVIERPCDIARHFLTTYGAASSFETGATAFGSFVNARNLLKNASPNDFKLAAWMGEASSVQRYLQKLCEQSLMCVVQDTFTDKWLCHIWKQGAAVDYDLTFTRNELPDLFEPSLTSSVSLLQGVRVRYGYDYFRNRTQYECYVGATGSSQGYNLPTTRDQVLTVSASNNKVDWNDGAVRVATLTSATYTPIDLADHVQVQMRAVAGTHNVGFGFDIKASFNDALVVTVGGSPYTATMTAGSYTADSLAIEGARALNAAGTGRTWTVTYNHSTNMFEWTVTGAAITMLAATSTCFAFGFVFATATSRANNWPRYADRFYFVSGTTITLLWSSGANAATGAGPLLGWNADQSVSAVVDYPYATYARGQRETTCAASQNLYGPRGDSIITADWIKNEASAQQRRDREFDFGSAPRVRLVARTHFAPDLQVMRVIGISSDMDSRRAYPKYGSDGSWAGKPLRVLSVLHDNGPSYHTEFLAEEA